MNRAEIEDTIERLISMLDTLDGDADHEPNTGDEEPSHGADEPELDPVDAGEPDDDGEWDYRHNEHVAA